MKTVHIFAEIYLQSPLVLKLSWFRASALQAEGRRFEPVNPHNKALFPNGAFFLQQTLTIP